MLVVMVVVVVAAAMVALRQSLTIYLPQAGQNPIM